MIASPQLSSGSNQFKIIWLFSEVYDVAIIAVATAPLALGLGSRKLTVGAEA